MRVTNLAGFIIFICFFQACLWASAVKVPQWDISGHWLYGILKDKRVHFSLGESLQSNEPLWKGACSKSRKSVMCLCLHKYLQCKVFLCYVRLLHFEALRKLLWTPSFLKLMKPSHWLWGRNYTNPDRCWYTP